MEQYNATKYSNNEQALVLVLNDCGIPKHSLSIGGPSEQSVCLEKNGSIYTVYMVERGKRFEETIHESEHEAHLKVLYHLSPSNEAYAEMCKLYERRIRYQTLKKNRSVIQSYYGSKYISPKIVAASKTPAISAIKLGDTVRVRTKVNKGFPDRIKVFEGQVIGKKNTGVEQTITIRPSAHGVACEKAFVIKSPQIDSIETISTVKAGYARPLKRNRKSRNLARYKKKV